MNVLVPVTANNIRRRRLDLGYQSKYTAELLGVTPSYLTNIEKGKEKPSPKMLLKIAQVLEYEGLSQGTIAPYVFFVREEIG